jgi:hypothetical protein
MTIDALLYLDAELTGDDLALLARDWRRWRASRRVSIGGSPGDGWLTVSRGGMPVMLRLIRPGSYGEFLLAEECLPGELAGPPPFRPRSILALGVVASPTARAHLGLRLAIELAADCARRWPCRLVSDAAGDDRRVYTREDIIQAERQGRQLE